MKLAVVGGGIAGLAAAWQARDRADVTIFEPERVGGKILTSDFGGRPVDCGADAFITRAPQAVELCAELGLESPLVAPGAGRTLLWWGGKLRPLPDGLTLGVPGRVGPLVRSGLLSPAGLLRAAADVVLPRRALADDCSVFDLVASRFGGQVAERLVDPLVGGIHAGRTDELSAAATTPEILAMARRSRSVLLGLRHAGGHSGGHSGGALFLAPRHGMGALVDALEQALKRAGVRFARSRVTRLQPVGPAIVVEPAGETFDGAVLSTPAAEAARILYPRAPGLAGIRCASVALVTLAYRGLDPPPDANGILVPRPEGRLMTACSFWSSKWPHSSPPGIDVVRVSAGRSRDTRALQLDDEELVERLSEELTSALETRVLPAAHRVSRWPDAFPQYEVGHLARVASIESELRRDLPSVTIAGAAYRGAGIPACVASGRAAARRLLERSAPER